jgi:hypothetical protein
LSEVPTAILQKAVINYKSQLKEDEKILNTNLEAMGITI